MNYEEFKEKDNQLQSELMDLRRNYYIYCNDLYSNYKGKKVKIKYGDEYVVVFWDGWSMPRGGHLEPVCFKVKKDGTPSSFHENLWSINPGNIEIALADE